MTAPWQRHDGFDPRDPSAPAVFMCTGCDASRDKATAFCPNCNEVTGSYFGAGAPVSGVARTCTLDGLDIARREAEQHREIARKAA